MPIGPPMVSGDCPTWSHGAAAFAYGLTYTSAPGGSVCTEVGINESFLNFVNSASADRIGSSRRRRKYTSEYFSCFISTGTCASVCFAVRTCRVRYAYQPPAAIARIATTALAAAAFDIRGDAIARAAV